MICAQVLKTSVRCGTERQQGGMLHTGRSKALNLAKNIYKLKEKDKAAFYFPTEEWVLPAASTRDPEEREFVVDSGASRQNGQQERP